MNTNYDLDNKGLDCEIYRSQRHEGMYIYLPAGTELQDLPEVLLQRFGSGELAMRLIIDENRKLARAQVVDVMAAIKEQGFYLQMPPREWDEAMQQVSQQNSKLS